MSGAINFFMVFLLGNTAMVHTEVLKPTLRLEPEQSVYIAGESLLLRCVADTPTRITGYSFFKDAALIANNSATNILTIKFLSITDAGNYFCTYYKEVADKIQESQYINLRVLELLPAPTLSVEPKRNVFVVNQSVVLQCNVPRGQSAMEVTLYENERPIYEADNFGVLSLANTKIRNTNYTCRYRNAISGRTVESHPSNQETLVVIDLPPTPILRYAKSLQNQSRQVEIVCEILNPSFSLINGYHLYRNGGEILATRQVNQFVINYNLEFDGCYSCRSFVNILGEEFLSLKSVEVFLTLEEGNSRDCQTQNSPAVYGLSKQGIKLYGSVLIGKLIVLIFIFLIFGIHLIKIHLRNKKSETEEQSFHRL